MIARWRNLWSITRSMSSFQSHIQKKFPRLFWIRSGSPVLMFTMVCCPKYRGRLPLFWAMLNDEAEFGLTVHEMDEAWDNGPILVQERIPVRPPDSLHSLFLRATDFAPHLLIKALNILKSADGLRLPNPASQATYHSFPTAADGRRFRAASKRFID